MGQSIVLQPKRSQSILIGQMQNQLRAPRDGGTVPGSEPSLLVRMKVGFCTKAWVGYLYSHRKKVFGCGMKNSGGCGLSLHFIRISLPWKKDGSFIMDPATKVLFSTHSEMKNGGPYRNEDTFYYQQTISVQMIDCLDLDKYSFAQ